MTVGERTRVKCRVRVVSKPKECQDGGVTELG